MIQAIIDELILIKILSEQSQLEIISLSVELPDGSRIVLE